MGFFLYFLLFYVNYTHHFVIQKRQYIDKTAFFRTKYLHSHLASSISVFMPFIFSPRTKTSNCLTFSRRTATKA